MDELEWWYDVEEDKAVQLVPIEALQRSLQCGRFKGPRLYKIEGPDGVAAVKALYGPFELQDPVTIIPWPSTKDMLKGLEDE